MHTENTVKNRESQRRKKISHTKKSNNNNKSKVTTENKNERNSQVYDGDTAFHLKFSLLKLKSSYFISAKIYNKTDKCEKIDQQYKNNIPVKFSRSKNNFTRSKRRKREEKKIKITHKVTS